ncbi:MAG: putative toxin-antitoxin system toxin component, PIN family [Spirochaetota bacterium]|nr:putative toxin-antitoxin system toxin component, PIN family [Spirochaetota bacterium]
MITVIDTNVIFQGLDSSKGASYFILELLKDHKINLALSYQVITEYEEVLKRNTTLERLKLDSTDIDDILAYFAYIAFPYEPTYILRPNLRDEKDNIFVELAFVSNADYLITSNIKDFTKNNDLKFDNFTVITPGEFVVKWRRQNEN